MLAHTKSQRSWIGNDPQQKLEILGLKYPITTYIVIGWVLAHNSKMELNRNDTHRNVDALHLNTTQNSRHKIRMQLEQISILSNTSAHGNKYRICMGLAPSRTRTVLGWIFAHKNTSGNLDGSAHSDKHGHWMGAGPEKHGC